MLAHPGAAALRFGVDSCGHAVSERVPGDVVADASDESTGRQLIQFTDSRIFFHPGESSMVHL